MEACPFLGRNRSPYKRNQHICESVTESDSRNRGEDVGLNVTFLVELLGASRAVCVRIGVVMQPLKQGQITGKS